MTEQMNFTLLEELQWTPWQPLQDSGCDRDLPLYRIRRVGFHGQAKTLALSRHSGIQGALAPKEPGKRRSDSSRFAADSTPEALSHGHLSRSPCPAGLSPATKPASIVRRSPERRVTGTILKEMFRFSCLLSGLYR